MAAPYILARTMQEAHAFARRDLGLARGQYRIVNSPSTLKSVRGVDLHLVPGWQNRFDRFAMKGALRWTRMNVIDKVERAEAPAKTVVEVAVQVAEEMNSDDATEFLLASPPAAEQVATVLELPSRPQPVETEEKPKRTRRRRCDDCGTLVEPSEMEAHKQQDCV